MKTAVIGEAGGSVVYNRALVDFARHYGFQPKACRPYRAKTKDEVRNLSHNWVGLAAPNLAELEVAKRNQASKREPPCQTWCGGPWRKR